MKIEDIIRQKLYFRYGRCLGGRPPAPDSGVAP